MRRRKRLLACKTIPIRLAARGITRNLIPWLHIRMEMARAFGTRKDLKHRIKLRLDLDGTTS